MEAPLLIGPGYEQGRRSRGHPQDVTARSRQVHVSRIANSPFRVVSAGSAPRRALPPADGARAIPRSETIAHTVGESPRRVTIGGSAPRPSPGGGRRSHGHWTRMTHPSFRRSGQPAGFPRHRLCSESRSAEEAVIRRRAGQAGAPVCGPLCGWPGHAGQLLRPVPGWPGEHGQRSRAIPGPLTGDDRERSGKRRTTHPPLRHARPSFPPARGSSGIPYSAPEIHAMRANRTGIVTTG